jgi:hypothetical protein
MSMSEANLKRFMDDLAALPAGTLVRVHWPARADEESGFIIAERVGDDKVRDVWAPWEMDEDEELDLIHDYNWANDLWCEPIPDDEAARILALAALNPDLLGKELLDEPQE